jgi:hypothetical protein
MYTARRLLPQTTAVVTVVHTLRPDVKSAAATTGTQVPVGRSGPQRQVFMELHTDISYTKKCSENTSTPERILLLYLLLSTHFHSNKALLLYQSTNTEQETLKTQVNYFVSKNCNINLNI